MFKWHIRNTVNKQRICGNHLTYDCDFIAFLLLNERTRQEPFYLTFFMPRLIYNYSY